MYHATKHPTWQRAVHAQAQTHSQSLAIARHHWLVIAKHPTRALILSLSFSAEILYPRLSLAQDGSTLSHLVFISLCSAPLCQCRASTPDSRISYASFIVPRSPPLPCSSLSLRHTPCRLTPTHSHLLTVRPSHHTIVPPSHPLAYSKPLRNSHRRRQRRAMIAVPTRDALIATAFLSALVLLTLSTGFAPRVSQLRRAHVPSDAARSCAATFVQSRFPSSPTNATLQSSTSSSAPPQLKAEAFQTASTITLILHAPMAYVVHVKDMKATVGKTPKMKVHLKVVEEKAKSVENVFKFAELTAPDLKGCCARKLFVAVKTELCARPGLRRCVLREMTVGIPVVCTSLMWKSNNTMFGEAGILLHW